MTDDAAAPRSSISGDTTPPASRHHDLLLLALCCVALALRVPLALRSLPDGLFDDSYITLRYAANVSNGLGFVYNLGERVWGTTTPLFALLLAGAAKLFGAEALPWVAAGIGVVASVGTVVATAWTLRRSAVEPAAYWLYLGALACLPVFVGSSVSGMETSLVVCLMALSLGLYASGSLPGVGLVCGLLLVARIDTAIWVAALMGHGIHEYRRRPLGTLRRVLGPALLVALPWFAFAWLYFGTVVPQSVIGKAVSHGAFQRLDPAYVLSFLSTYVPAVGTHAVAWGIVLGGLLLAGIGAIRVWRTHRRLRPLVTFFLLYNAALLVSRAPLFSWYFPPAEWPFYLFAIMGTLGLAQLASRMVRFPALVRVTAGVLASVILAGTAHWFVHDIQRRADAPWARVASFVSRYTRPDATIFIEHIGLVGFKTGRHIYDPMGLVTPEVVALKRRLGERWLPTAISRARADVVVLYREELPGAPPWLPDETADFAAHYRAVTDVAGLEGYMVRIYFRQGSPMVPAMVPAVDTSSGD